MSATSTVRSLQGRRAAAQRWAKDDVDDLSRDYAAEKLAEYIKRTVDAAPSLTAEQRDRLILLLNPSRGGRDTRPLVEGGNDE